MSGRGPVECRWRAGRMPGEGRSKPGRMAGEGRSKAGRTVWGSISTFCTLGISEKSWTGDGRGGGPPEPQILTRIEVLTSNLRTSNLRSRLRFLWFCGSKGYHRFLAAGRPTGLPTGHTGARCQTSYLACWGMGGEVTRLGRPWTSRSRARSLGLGSSRSVVTSSG